MQQAHLVVLPQKRLECVHAHGQDELRGVSEGHHLPEAKVVGRLAALLQYLRLSDPVPPIWHRSNLYMFPTVSSDARKETHP